MIYISYEWFNITLDQLSYSNTTLPKNGVFCLSPSNMEKLENKKINQFLKIKSQVFDKLKKNKMLRKLENYI